MKRVGLVTIILIGIEIVFLAGIIFCQQVKSKQNIKVAPGDEASSPVLPSDETEKKTEEVLVSVASGTEEDKEEEESNVVVIEVASPLGKRLSEVKLILSGPVFFVEF